MAQAPLISDSKLAEADAANFESLLRESWDKPWWREFITKVHERRASWLQNMVDGTDSQREEDRLRGKIKELSWIIAIDALGKHLHEEKRNG